MYNYIQKFTFEDNVNRPQGNRLFKAMENGDNYKELLNELAMDEVDVVSLHWTMRSTTEGDMVLVTKNKLSNFAEDSLKLDIRDFRRAEHTFVKVAKALYSYPKYEYQSLTLISDADLHAYTQKYIDARKPENEYKEALTKFEANHPGDYFYTAKTQFYGKDIRYGCGYMNGVDFNSSGPFPKEFEFIHGFRNHVLVIIATEKPMTKEALSYAEGELDVQFSDGAGEGLDDGGFADVTPFEPLK